MKTIDPNNPKHIKRTVEAFRKAQPTSAEDFCADIEIGDGATLTPAMLLAWNKATKPYAPPSKRRAELRRSPSSSSSSSSKD